MKKLTDEALAVKLVEAEDAQSRAHAVFTSARTYADMLRQMVAERTCPLKPGDVFDWDARGRSRGLRRYCLVRVVEWRVLDDSHVSGKLNVQTVPKKGGDGTSKFLYVWGDLSERATIVSRGNMPLPEGEIQ